MLFKCANWHQRRYVGKKKIFSIFHVPYEWVQMSAKNVHKIHVTRKEENNVCLIENGIIVNKIAYRMETCPKFNFFFFGSNVHGTTLHDIFQFVSMDRAREWNDECGKKIQIYENDVVSAFFHGIIPFISYLKKYFLSFSQLSLFITFRIDESNMIW